jgi:hypothetical protein
VATWSQWTQRYVVDDARAVVEIFSFFCFFSARSFLSDFLDEVWKRERIVLWKKALHSKIGFGSRGEFVS